MANFRDYILDIVAWSETGAPEGDAQLLFPKIEVQANAVRGDENALVTAIFPIFEIESEGNPLNAAQISIPFEVYSGNSNIGNIQLELEVESSGENVTKGECLIPFQVQSTANPKDWTQIYLDIFVDAVGQPNYVWELCVDPNQDIL